MSESLWCVECTVGGHIMSYPVRSLQSDVILQTEIAMQIPIVQQKILQTTVGCSMIFRCITNMLEYQSVDVLADIFSSFFLALPDLRC